MESSLLKEDSQYDPQEYLEHTVSDNDASQKYLILSVSRQTLPNKRKCEEENTSASDVVRKSKQVPSRQKKRRKIGARKHKPTVCEVCGKKFRDNHNMKRHFETIHSKQYACNSCSAVYNTEKKLECHMKKHISPKIKGNDRLMCNDCNRVFRYKHNLRTHKCSKTCKRAACLYPECNVTFYHVTKMLKHVEEDHNHVIDTINMTFESEALFQRWKEEEELKSYAYFSKRSGTMDSDYGSYRCYVCQANGDSIDMPRKTNKRWRKGPVRSGKLCPSRMLVREINGKINVKYISFHTHTRDAKNDKLPVPKSVKMYAKNLLMMGASPQQVRKSVCLGLYGGSSIIPQGGYVISNRYFSDMKKRLDSRSFANPGTEEEQEKYDPVFVYKPPGQTVIIGDEALDMLPHSADLFAIGLQAKDQCIMMKKRAHKIVSVTSTHFHNLSGYEILTLTVPDVFGNGYPIAYFLTSHTDKETLTLLFGCLRAKCPSVKVKYVMTDDNAAIYDAMCSTFGKVKHYLCHWYVKQCWEKEIHSNCKTCDGVSIGLDALLHEEKKSVFREMSNDFKEKYCYHPADFVKNFASKYLTKPDVWAACYRHSSRNAYYHLPYTNVALHCEFIQNRLKEFILDEKTDGSHKIADVALVILQIQEGHSLLYKKQLQRGIRVRSAATGKHHLGLQISNESITGLSGMWKVKSQFDDSAVYTVKEKVIACTQLSCPEVCNDPPCENLCNHMYECTCEDRFPLCEHIHRVHSFRLQQRKSNNATLLSSKLKLGNIEFTVSEISESPNTGNPSAVTIVKKEREDFTDTDVDFVSISLNIGNDHAEILETLSATKKELYVQRKVMKEENGLRKKQNKKWKCATTKKYVSCKDQNCGVGKVENNRVQNLVQIDCDDVKKSKSYHPSLKIEYVDDCENGEPLIAKKRLPDASEGMIQSVDSVKVECSSEVPFIKDETKRCRTRRYGSIIQCAIENKKKRLEVPMVKDCKIKREDTSVNSMEDVVSNKSKNLKCNHCNNMFRDTYNLDRHIRSKHLCQVLYDCVKCPKTFKTKSNLETHLKKHKGTSSIKTVQCTKCLRMFRDQYNMKHHRCDKARKQSVCIYPGCSMQYYHMTQMVKHIEVDHQDEVDSCSLQFESEKLFLAWKEEEESASLTVFNKRNGSLTSDNVRYSYYVCQAGGESTGAVGKTSRRWRTKWRTGKACPSRMLVKEKDKKITVRYISYHSHDVKDNYKVYPPLPKYVKELGKQLLLMGFSPKRIRDSVQDGVLLDEGKTTQKSYAVKSRYFYDMKKRLEKKGYVFPCETEKAEAVEQGEAEKAEAVDQGETEKTEAVDQGNYWQPRDLDELIVYGKHKNYTPFLVYKPISDIEEDLLTLPYSNKLFALGFQTKNQYEKMKEGVKRVLCIRSYFDINRDGFQLLNLTVPDKFGNGYPIAHFITNYVNEPTLTFLFRSLKKCYPNLKIKSLITDNDSCVYNAFQAVYKDVNHYLCHWYVKNSWFEKVEQLVESPDHKVDIPFNLMDILYERDEKHFHLLCQNFRDMYSNVCTDFMKFFVDHYLGKPETWAMCYRQNYDDIADAEPYSNVSLHCEYLHNKLKLLNLTGKFSLRVGELTKSLLKFEKDYSTIYQKNMVFSFQVHSSASGSHHTGIEIEDEKVYGAGDTWTVISRLDKTTKYSVKVLENNCNRVNCYEKCMEFLCLGLCNHLYVCSCEDRSTLCEHIHKVHSLRLKLDKPDNVETLMGERMSSIQVIVHEDLDKDLPFGNELKVELEPFPSLDPCDDRVICHEIYEMDK